MNDKFTENNREEDIAQKVDRVVEQTHANPQFAAELEQKLRAAHRPQASRFVASFRQVSPVLRWTALMVLLVLVLSLSIKTLIPAPQPGQEGAPSSEAPAVLPSDTPLPPFDYTVKAGDTCGGLAASFGVSLQSLIVMNNLSADCVIYEGQSLKIPYPTPTPGSPSTTVPDGQSFDYGGAKLIMNAAFPDVPAQTNVYAMHAYRPATVEHAQALASQLGIEGEVYTTQPYPQDEAAYMVTDGKQRLVVHTENVYSYTSDLVKYSRSLNGSRGVSHENAEAIIREFLNTHGFLFDFRVEADTRPGNYRVQQLSPDGLPFVGSNMFVTLDENGNILNMDVSLVDYDAVPLGSYGIITAEEALQQLVDDSAPIGVIQGGNSVPDPNVPSPQYWYYDYPDNQTVTVYGNVAVHAAVDSNLPAMIFLENVPVTGNTDGMEALDEFAFIQATGQFSVENGVRKFNVDTWDKNAELTCAAGFARRAGEQILVTNEGESRSEYTLVEPPADLPLDTSFPDSRLIACGSVIDGQFHWNSIQYFPDSSQMGGGGGGGGYFYQLNLSGTPVPFPTVAPTQQSPYSAAELSAFPKYTVQPDDTLAKIAQSYNVSVEDLMQANGITENMVFTDTTLIIPTTRVEGERGMVTVQIFENSAGRQRTSYIFTGEDSDAYYQLEGDNLEPLQKVARRPIKIWGDITPNDKGIPILNMERFESIYPDLQFQVLTGTQALKEIDGNKVLLFTSGGTTYIQMTSDGGYPYPEGNSFQDTEEIQIEVLQVPDETYAGYPALRVFSMGPAINPTTGEPMELAHTADEIEVVPDPWGQDEPFSSPDIIIEKVELMYSASDYGSEGPSESSPPQLYVQPVWHFQGHNEHGDEVSIIVQALRQEHLLPEPEQ